jgi:hypothetical protein
VKPRRIATKSTSPSAETTKRIVFAAINTLIAGVNGPGPNEYAKFDVAG